MTISFSELKTLDYSFRGEPFCYIGYNDSISTLTLDYAYKAEPFVTRSIEVVQSVTASITISVPEPILFYGYITEPEPAIISIAPSVNALISILLNPISEINIGCISAFSKNLIYRPTSKIKIAGTCISADIARSFSLSVVPANIISTAMAYPQDPRHVYSHPGSITISGYTKKISVNLIQKVKTTKANISIKAKPKSIGRGIGRIPADIIISSTIRKLNEINQVVPSNPANININFNAIIIQNSIISTSANIITSGKLTVLLKTKIFISNIDITSKVKSVGVALSLKVLTEISTDLLITLDYVYNAEPFVECYIDDKSQTKSGGTLDYSFRAEPFVFCMADTQPFVHRNNRNANKLLVYERYPYPGYQDVDGILYKKLNI